MSLKRKSRKTEDNAITPIHAGHERLDYSVEIFERILFWAIPLLIIGLILNYIRHLSFGGKWFTYIQYASIIIIFLTLIFRRMISLRTRITIYCFCGLCFGLAGLMQWGLLGQGLLVIIFAIVLASLASVRHWLIAMVIALIAVSFVAVGFVRGYLSIAVDPAEFMRSASAWATAIITLAFIGLIVLFWEQVHVRLLQKTKDLHERDQQLRAITETITCAVYRCALDANWTIEFIGPQIEKITGYPPSDLVNNVVRSYSSLIHPEDKEMVDRLVRHAIDKNQPWMIDYQIIHADGSIRWVYEEGRAIKDNQGEVLYLDGFIIDNTNRRQAEEILRRYEHIISSTDDLMSFLDKDYIYQAVNEAYLIAHAKKREEIIGFSVEQLLGMETFNKLVKEYLDRAFAGETVQYQSWFEYAGIGQRYMDVVYYPFKDDDGHISGVVVKAHDVTEHRKAEEALGESQQFLQNTFDAIQDGISVLDPNLNVIKTNRWMEKMYADRAPIAGKKCYEVYQRRETACPWCPSIRTLETGETHTEIVPYPSVEKPTGWIELSAFPIKDKKGNVVNIIEYVKDITDRRRAEEALRESEAKFRSVVESSPMGIHMYQLESDNRLVFMGANRAADRILGVDNSQFIGKTIEEAFPPLAATEVPERYRTAAALGEPWNTEQITYKDEKITGAYEVHAFQTEPGKMVAMFLDITDRRLAEEEKAKLEEQYHRALRLESIGRLAGGVAHDLNNLLSPILGYGEMLLEEAGEDEKRREPIEEIMYAGERARELVRRLLAFGRKQTLDIKNIDLNAVLEKFEKFLRRTIREDIAIKILSAKELPPVKGDPGQLEQVVMNLAVNAQDAMPDGGELKIETAHIDLSDTYAAEHEGIEPGSYVMLMVNDTGFGMDKEVRDHIFEPFFTTKGRDQGTGLGLATVYGIVKQHGGHIHVYSKPNKGATFKIYIPVSEIPHVEEPVFDKKIANLKGTETILLVEDNEQVRHLSQTILKRQGYNVLAAENGHEALDILSSNPNKIDLLLTDVVMPEMNGKDLYLRANEKFPHLKVIYMSGYTDDVIVHHGVLDEGIAFIQKPFSVKTLSSKIREVLEGE